MLYDVKKLDEKDYKKECARFLIAPHKPISSFHKLILTTLLCALISTNLANAQSSQEAIAINKAQDKRLQKWSGIYSFSENADSKELDLSKSRQQIFRFFDCECVRCLVEYEALNKYSTCKIKDDRLLSLKILSPNQATLHLKIKDKNNVEKTCEVALQKTQKGFKAKNPLDAIKSCNISLSIFETCGAGTNPDWTMEFIKE